MELSANTSKDVSDEWSAGQGFSIKDNDHGRALCIRPKASISTMSAISLDGLSIRHRPDSSWANNSLGVAFISQEDCLNRVSSAVLPYRLLLLPSCHLTQYKKRVSNWSSSPEDDGYGVDFVIRNPCHSKIKAWRESSRRHLRDQLTRSFLDPAGRRRLYIAWCSRLGWALSRWAARDTYNPRRDSRISTAKPAAKPWIYCWISNVGI